MKSALIFLVSLGALYLCHLACGLLPASNMRATVLQATLGLVLLLVTYTVIAIALIFGIGVLDLLFKVYEAGSKVLNGPDHRNDF